MYNPDIDAKLRAVANEAIKFHNVQDAESCKNKIRETVGLLESFSEPLDGSEDILSLLVLLSRTYKDRESLIVLDRLLSAMMGDGVIQHNPDAVNSLANVVAEIAKFSQSCNDNDSKSALRRTISNLIEGRSWHYSEQEYVHQLFQVTQQHGFVSFSDSLAIVHGQLKAQKTKFDLFNIPEREPYLGRIDYPAVVTIETFMKCNARCTFCPYPVMAEQGIRAEDKMSTALYEKIINDLKDIPPQIGFTLNLSRVNEPLLDTRIYDFLKHANDELPGCSVWLPSNGSTLTEKNLNRLNDIPCFSSLGISINSNDPDEYERIMGLPFERTVRNIDRLHAMMTAGELNFKVLLSHVVVDREKQQEINAWINDRWPGFDITAYEPTDWLGRTSNKTRGKQAPVTPCLDWYQVHILADGNEALCCFDAYGEHAQGNARDQHILDIYNVAWQRKARKYMLARQSETVPEICHQCPIR